MSTNDIRGPGGIDRRHVLLAAGATAVMVGTDATVAASSSKPPSMAQWRTAETIELWPDGSPDRDQFRPRAMPNKNKPAEIANIQRPAIHVFRSPRPNGQGLLVIPGGGYAYVSVDNEGVDVANCFTAMGMTVFVLTYRLPGEGWPERKDVALSDAQRAMRLIRARAAGFGVAPDRLAVMGFSAGGHLAATLATDFALRPRPPIDAVDRLSARPFAAALLYPVVTMRPSFTHAGSRDLLLGPNPSAIDVAARSPEDHVAVDTPAMFLAHAFDDDAVPVDNSLLLADAMRRANRPVEVHLFQQGRHAFGIGRAGTPSASWPDLFARWLGGLDGAGV